MTRKLSVPNTQSLLNAPIFTVENIACVITVCSIYLITLPMRQNVSSIWAYCNFGFYLAVIMLVIKFKGVVGVGATIIWAVASGLLLGTNLRAGVGLVENVRAFSMYSLPLLVGHLNFKSSIDCRHVVKMIVKTLNFIVLIVFLTLILDLLSNTAVTGFLYDHLMPSISTLATTDLSRHASIWGHYLTTAGFYLVFFFMNIAYQKLEGECLLDARILYIVSAIGIAATAGKAALVIFLIAVVWVNITGAHKIRNCIGLTGLLLLLYYAGAFDYVLSRFDTADLSSGRDAAVQQMMQWETPGLFSSHGEAFTDYSTALIGESQGVVVMEYALLGLSYKYGYVFVALFCALVLWPFIEVAKSRSNWSIALMGVLTLAYFATYNGIIYISDTLLAIVLFAFEVRMLGTERPVIHASEPSNDETYLSQSRKTV